MDVRFVLAMVMCFGVAGAEDKPKTKAKTKNPTCSSVILSHASFDNVKLVGTVTQGKKTRALVMHKDHGFIVEQGECDAVP